MILSHRIRSTQGHFSHIPQGGKFVLGISDTNRLQGPVQQAGFSFPLTPGDTILPDKKHGRSARINAEGWIERHTDQPKETVYYPVVWHWMVKRGHFLEPHSRIVNRPVRRFPRTLHKPFGMELSVTPNAAGGMLLTFPAMTMGQVSNLQLVIAVNTLIEMFGECHVMTESLDSLISAPIKHLNWDILPKGELPWEKLQHHLRPVVAQRRGKSQEVHGHRFAVINSFGPSFCAIGKHGFRGYVVFGFPKKDFYLLESIYAGNATYGLGEDWENLSQFTKGDLLEHGLHKFRVVHSAGWESEIRHLFSGRRAA